MKNKAKIKRNYDMLIDVIVIMDLTKPSCIITPRSSKKNILAKRLTYFESSEK